MFKLSNKKKILLPILIGMLLLISLTIIAQSQDKIQSAVEGEISYKPNYVKVKYKDDLVDIGHSRFEYLDTSKSSFVRGAWYDKSNSYMIIKLKETYYQYCGMPLKIWTQFKKADSFGTFYKNYIKGYYDCRINYIPTYKNIED